MAEKMVKVRFVKPCADGIIQYAENSVASVSERKADKWIKAKVAEIVEGSKKAK